MNHAHIGQIIKKIVKEKNISVTEFAKRLNCQRANVYDIFLRHSIDTELLARIQKIWGCSFGELLVENEFVEKDYLVFIGTNESKIKEMQADDSIKIIKIWKSV
jgi:transcriptional regulator with XRE-family HTH domain